MMKFVLAVLLPLSVIFYGAYLPYWSNSTSAPGPRTNGTLEKLIVADGSVTLEIDSNKLESTNFRTKDPRPTSVRFDAASDSFFSIKVFNGELRGPLPGTISLVSKNTADLPARLRNSLQNLAIESSSWSDDSDLFVRDAKTGFRFFDIEGQTYDYSPAERIFAIEGGRLLIAKEFATELGRPADAGAIVGRIAVAASMRKIEVSQIVDGDVTSDELPALGDPESGSVPGPDVVVGSLSGLAQFGNSSGTQVGLAVGTDSCNFGSENLHWQANPVNDHPVIPQNLYRMSGGATNDERFEQIGQSNVKHAFAALTENICNLGCNGVGNTALGSGCSDPYDASLNAGPSLGSRAWINPFTGFYPRNDSATPNNNHTGHTHLGPSHRILTEIADLNTSLNPGAKYYAEAQYITPHEYAWCQTHPSQCNMYNNVSYRRFNVSGTSSPFAFGTVAGEGTQRMKAAVNAWTGATLTEINPDPGNDGIGTVAYKVTNPSPGVWHYEYALFNQNLDRAIQSFGVPISASAAISNIGFHAPPQHPGWSADGTVGNAGYSSTPWTQNLTSSAMTWNTETFAQNQNANAIRWGTLYNFRFDSNKPPQLVDATVGFLKTGAPINLAVQAPADPLTNLTVSGRVTSPVFRGIGNVKITLSDGVNPPRVTYSNSFGFYRFDNVSNGTYAITAFKLRHSFSPKQMAITANISNLDFVTGQ